MIPFAPLRVTPHTRITVMRLLPALAFLSLLPVSLPAQSDDASRLVAALLGDTPMTSDLETLTDRIGGRPTGSEANRRAFDWAIEFDKRMASVVASGRHSDATGFLSLGPLAQLAHPTYDHFLPFLYALGLIEPGGPVRTFCEGFQWPGISMRSFVLA